MTLTYLSGDIFKSEADALVNPVNTVGVMGKGLALQFKKKYPDNFKAYQDACKNGEINIGELFVFKVADSEFESRLIVNFPTKTHWRKASEYDYIEKGMDNLVYVIKERRIKKIAIPALGAGLGGLDWQAVRNIIEEKLKDLEIHAFIYEPWGVKISEHSHEKM